jgi:hypothetical protein
MVAQFMVQPSSLMRSGITMSQRGEVYLFKFNNELQIPQSLGGSDNEDNLALACHRCNTRHYNSTTVID